MSTQSGRDHWDRSLVRLDVPEARYKADLELHDRSQHFSSELLKLALGGVAIVGFLLAHFPEERLDRVLDDSTIGILFSASVVAFALSAASALLQRFYAAGAMFHHFHAIKLSLLKDPSADEEIASHLNIRGRKFTQAHSLLKITALLLVVATSVVSVAFVRMMFLHA
jgi:hypothetical protein